MTLLFTTTWYCTGDKKYHHPLVFNHTNQCSHCKRECPLFIKFWLWVKGDGSYQLYERKIIIWSLLGVSLTLFSYSLFQKLIQLELHIASSQSQITHLFNKLLIKNNDYNDLAKESNKMQQNLSKTQNDLIKAQNSLADITEQRDDLSRQLNNYDYRSLTFVYTPESKKMKRLDSGNKISFSGQLSSSQKENFYYLDVKTTSQFNLILSNLNRDADIFIVELCRDGSKRNIAQSVKGGTRNDTINQKLDPGIYMIQIKLLGNSSTSYNLNVTRKN